MQMLEADLNEFDRILSFNLAQVEDNQVKHLFHLHRVFLVFVFFEGYLVDDRSKPKLDERFYPLENVGGWFFVQTWFLLGFNREAIV